jgi:hypothetical protein
MKDFEAIRQEGIIESLRIAEVEARGKLNERTADEYIADFDDAVNEDEINLPDVFISVYMPVAGWKAIMYAIDDECGGEYTPHATGSFAHTTKAAAVSEARSWARDEELTYIDTCPTKCDDAPSESVTEQISAILFSKGETK